MLQHIMNYTSCPNGTLFSYSYFRNNNAQCNCLAKYSEHSYGVKRSWYD